MPEHKAASTYWCRCIHVRHATLLLAVGYLIVHLLGMYLLVYLSANFDALNAPKTQTEVVVQQPIGMMQNMDLVYASEGDTAEDIQARQPYLRITNIRWWINIFVINDNAGAKLNRYDLNMGMMFETVNGLVALMTVVGVLKRWPGCLVPFLLNHVFDVIFAVLTMCRVQITSSSQPNIFTAGVVGSPIANAMQDHGSQVAIVLGICKIIFKLCVLRIVVMCIKHLRDVNNRIFRDERHEKWATKLLEGHISVETPIPPPRYEDSELDLTADDPSLYMSRKVTEI